MAKNLEGLSQVVGNRTIVNTGSVPLVLSEDLRGGVKRITGDTGDTLADLDPRSLQQGMLVFRESDSTYYQYRNVGTAPTNPPDPADPFRNNAGELPNTGNTDVNTDTSNWVEFSSGSGGTATTIASDPPTGSDRETGTQWVDNDTGREYVFNGTTWVQTGGPAVIDADTQVLDLGGRAYSSSAAYAAGDIVYDSDVVYISQTNNNMGNAVTDTTNWLPYGTLMGVDVTVTTTNGVSTLTIADGSVALGKLATTGTADATTFLRGDGSWQLVNTTLVQGDFDNTMGDVDFTVTNGVVQAGIDADARAGDRVLTTNSTNTGLEWRNHLLCG